MRIRPARLSLRFAGGVVAAVSLPLAGGLAAAFADASDASVFGPLLRDFFGFTHDESKPTTVI